MDQGSSNQGSSMDTNSSLSVWSTNIHPYEGRRCKCGAICTIKQSFAWRDFSRMYHGCPYFQVYPDAGCTFMDWVDPEMCGYGERAVQKFKSIYERLTRKCSHLETTVVELRRERAKHALDIATLKMENAKLMVDNDNLKKRNETLDVENAALLFGNAYLDSEEEGSGGCTNLDSQEQGSGGCT